MPSRPLEPGDPVRLGRFELLGRLGEGGQGVVYLGRGTNPGEERVAVKVLRSTVDANVLERLARELDAIHQVQPFVTAGVIEASAEGDRRYVVSEFIDGPSLQERVDDRGPAGVRRRQRARGHAPDHVRGAGRQRPAALPADHRPGVPGQGSGPAAEGARPAAPPGRPIGAARPGGFSCRRPGYGGTCVNTLTLTEATATVLTFDEPQAGGCVAGTVTFTRQGDGLAYRWTDSIEQNTATLRKG
jgi:Protein tyrosine and serine/threonine kinase